MYSIIPILQPYSDKNGLSKVTIQVICNRMKSYFPTKVKVGANNWEDGAVVKHAKKTFYNNQIKEHRNNIESRLIKRLKDDRYMSKKEFDEIVKGTVKANTASVLDYITKLQEQLQGKLSKGRIDHYGVMHNKLKEYAPDLNFGTVSIQWMQDFEAWLRSKKLDGNTVLSNMSLLIAVFNKAEKVSLIDSKQFKGYQRPKYVQKMPEYLTETELEKFFDYLQMIEKKGHKLAGYYYLLSAYTGYRLGNAKAFDYEKAVHGDNLALMNAKNKTVVSIPIYPKLRAVLNYIHDKPLTLSEDKIRKYCKEMFLFIGIKKDVSYHSSRHSFAMMLMNKGFTVDEVAELIGDSELIAKVYARISNQYLSKKIMERLG